MAISSIMATADHNTPTTGWDTGLRRYRRSDIEGTDRHARLEHPQLRRGGFFPFLDKRQGIVHVMGPEQGATLPGMTVVCGDSHTSTHGAFGALAFGIGTSEVEHVLATQTLLTKKAGNMLVKVDGHLPPGALRKTSSVGDRAYRHRGRHRLRNRIRRRRDRSTVDGRPHDRLQYGDRSGCARGHDRGGREDHRVRARPAVFSVGRSIRAGSGSLAHVEIGSRREVRPRARAACRRIKPQVTWGTSPEMVTTIDGRVPDPEAERDPVKREGIERALDYMGLEPKTPVTDIFLDKVFIGSCTNSRIEDLREAAWVVKKLGKQVASSVKLAMVVPGSGLVKAQAEREGLDKIFRGAGFESREPGCSMCLGDERGPARAGRALCVDQ